MILKENGYFKETFQN